MSLSLHTFPLMVADIGGTNARFGWIPRARAPMDAVEALLCSDYQTPEEAALSYLQRYAGGGRPARTAVAIASAISEGPIKVTNSDWVLDRPRFAARLGLHHVDVFNDFEAIAMVLPHLLPTEYTVIGPKGIDQSAAMAVLGPGTGLGVGGIAPIRSQRGNWHVITGEGGHVTLAGATAYQRELLLAAATEIDHVSAEALVSGIGLPALYRAVSRVQGKRPAVHELSAEEIGTLGVAGTDAMCEATMDAFCGLLGCVAGNLALTLGARGGVFIAGGIVPKLGEFFARSSFRTHFEAKGRYSEYLQGIGTAVITAPYPGLQGLAHNDSILA